MLRLNPDGTNPTDNPFFTGSTTDWQGAVWALGLRNPYTFAVQPGTGRCSSTTSARASGRRSTTALAGPTTAGPAAPRRCGKGSSRRRRRGRTTATRSWPTTIRSSAPSPAGCAITGGVFYPSGSQFGSAYAGKYFFADFCGNFIRVFDPANPGSPSHAGHLDRLCQRADHWQPGGPQGRCGRQPLLPCPRRDRRDLPHLVPGPGHHPAPGERHRRTRANRPASPSPPPAERRSLTSGRSFVAGNWTNISGATASTFTINNATTADAGQYRAVVTNSAGSATSNAATLTVNVAGQAPSNHAASVEPVA